MTIFEGFDEVEARIFNSTQALPVVTCNSSEEC